MVEHALRIFENRVLRRIFGHEKVELTGVCRKLHSSAMSSFII
jgi:hypothetical protein